MSAASFITRNAQPAGVSQDVDPDPKHRVFAQSQRAISDEADLHLGVRFAQSLLFLCVCDMLADEDLQVGTEPGVD